MARDIVYEIIKNQDFKLTQIDDWSAEAERGSSGASIVLGAFAGKKGRRVKLVIECLSTAEGVTITLTQCTSGYSGGIIGKRQADSIYSGIYEAVGEDLRKAGVFTSGRIIE